MPSETDDPRRGARLATLSVAAAMAHGLLAGFIVWTEMGQQARATSAVEIPVEMATPEEAEGKKGTQQAGAQAAKPSSAKPLSTEPPSGQPTAVQPPAEKPETPAPQAPPPPQEASGAPEGKVVERPQESDRKQAARTRGAEAKPEEPKEEPANPFGGLTSVEKPAPVEPLPTFASPQTAMMAARPRPAADPTNDNYRAKVLGKVAANMLEPERPRPKALAIVGFRVDGQGNIERVWLARPSGHADLDAEAMEMVRRSAPFPVPPPGADHNFGAAIAFGGDS